ncbi:MAG: hypothetical protein JSR17_01930 [Proteobacteria bacterium]|nr:hypothetical protein [Pseudomonadota bacterium]
MTIGPLSALLEKQKQTYEMVFKPEVSDFDTPRYHYDWWLFPLPITELGANSSPRAFYYSIDSTKTRALLENSSFKEIYLDCIEKYLGAQEVRWNGYGIRFAKLLLSLKHFISFTDDENEYASLNMKLRNFAELALKIADTKHIVDEFHAISTMRKYLQEYPSRDLTISTPNM